MEKIEIRKIEKQEEFINKAIEAYNRKGVQVIGLSGSPGTGKTTTLIRAIDAIGTDGGVVLTAPTNKAAINMLGINSELGSGNDNIAICTTYKGFNATITENDGDILSYDIRMKDNVSMAHQSRIVVIDEGSMMAMDFILKPVAELLKEDRDLLFIVVGDMYQLPEVNGVVDLNVLIPPLFTLVAEEDLVELTEPVRYGGPIHRVVSDLKRVILGDERWIDFYYKLQHGEYTHDAEEQWVMPVDRNLLPYIQANMIEDNVISETDIRGVFWRRDTFKTHNLNVKKLLGRDELFTPDETIINYSHFANDAGDAMMYIGDEAVVQSVDTGVNIGLRDETGETFKTYDLGIEITTVGRGNENLIIQTPIETERWDKFLKYQYNLASGRGTKSDWKRYSLIKSFMTEAHPAHGQTIHSSQGSTFGIGMIDMEDIYANSSNPFEMYRLAYTGFSRFRQGMAIGFKVR